MRSDITPGGKFPDYALPDHTKTVRKLSELQGEDPMILTLSRGHYCPKEHEQHRELAEFQSKFAVAYTKIVTISTDEHHQLQSFRATLGAQWPFLSDPERTIRDHLPAKPKGRTIVIGAGKGSAQMAAAFEKGDGREVTRLYRRGDLPEEQCWLRAPGWCLAYR